MIQIVGMIETQPVLGMLHESIEIWVICSRKPTNVLMVSTSDINCAVSSSLPAGGVRQVAIGNNSSGQWHNHEAQPATKFGDPCSLAIVEKRDARLLKALTVKLAKVAPLWMVGIEQIQRREGRLGRRRREIGQSGSS